MNSTLFLVVGPFGAAVAGRLRAELAGGAAPVALTYFPLSAEFEKSHSAELLARFAERTAAELHTLLRKSVTDENRGSGRLDLVLVADLAETEGTLLVAVLQTLSAVLRQEFAVMFPPGAPPEQRSVWLVAALATPPLTDTAAGRAARAALAAIERWHFGSPPTPILSRIYLLPQQNEVMPLSREDLERGVFLFLATVYLSGLREHESIRSRIEPPRDKSRLLATFAIAVADAEVDKVLTAFAWRNAVAGLSCLAAQCEGVPSPQRVLATADELALEQFCGELSRLAERHGAEPLSAQLSAANRSEAEALQRARRAVRELVERHIGEGDGLHEFPLMVSVLALARQRLLGETGAETSQQLFPLPAEEKAETGSEEGAVPPAPGASVQEAGFAALPSWARLLHGVLLGAVIGIAVAATVAVATAASAGAGSGGGPTVAGQAPFDAAAGLWGLIAAVLVGVSWLTGSAWALKRAEKRRAAQKEAAKPQSPKSASFKDALALQAALALRKRRVARGMLQIIGDEGQRLEALRVAVLDAHGHARDRLRGLGVKQGELPHPDDYTQLLEAETPLRRALLPASVLPQLWERSRAIRDTPLWAGELLRRAWPTGGIRHDLPFGPKEAWEAALEQQHQSLREQAVFSWPELHELLVEPLGRFLRTVPRALKFGVSWHRADGVGSDSLGAPSHAHEYLLVAPPDGRAAVERLLREHAAPETQVLSSSPRLSRVLLLRTAAEFDTASLELMTS